MAQQQHHLQPQGLFDPRAAHQDHMLHAEPAGEQAQRRSRLQTFSPALGIAVQAVSARWHPEGLNPLWRNIDKHGESDWTKASVASAQPDGYNHLMTNERSANLVADGNAVERWSHTFALHHSHFGVGPSEQRMWHCPWPSPLALLWEYCSQATMDEDVAAHCPGARTILFGPRLVAIVRAFNAHFQSPAGEPYGDLKHMELRAILYSLTSTQLQALLNSGQSPGSPDVNATHEAHPELRYSCSFNYIKLAMIKQAAVMTAKILKDWTADATASNRLDVPLPQESSASKMSVKQLLHLLERVFSHLWKVAASHAALCLIESGQSLGVLHASNTQLATGAAPTPERVEELKKNLLSKIVKHLEAMADDKLLQE